MLYVIMILITLLTIWYWCGRFPKFHSVLFGRDPGTLKSDSVPKKHPQLICSDLRLSNNWKFEDWNYGSRLYSPLTSSRSSAAADRRQGLCFTCAPLSLDFHDPAWNPSEFGMSPRKRRSRLVTTPSGCCRPPLRVCDSFLCVALLVSPSPSPM